MDQLTATRGSVSNMLATEVRKSRGLKFNETLKVTFEKYLNEDRTTYTTCSVLQLQDQDFNEPKRHLGSFEGITG